MRPVPTCTTTFLTRGTAITFEYPNFFFISGTTSFLYFWCNNAIYKFYILAPHFLHMRVFVFPSTRYPARVVLPQEPHTRPTLEACTDEGNCTTSPFWPDFRGRTWRFSICTPSTTTRSRSGRTRKIFPVRPRSFPASIFTLSPFLILIYYLIAWIPPFGGMVVWQPHLGGGQFTPLPPLMK